MKEGGLLFGWCDSSKKKTASEKLGEAMEEFRYKFGRDADFCRLNGALIPELPNPPLVLIAHAVPAHTMLLGVEDVTP